MLQQISQNREGLGNKGTGQEGNREREVEIGWGPSRTQRKASGNRDSAGELLGAGDGKRGGDGGGTEVAIGLGAAERKPVFACGYGALSRLIDSGQCSLIKPEADVLGLSGVEVKAVEAREGLFGRERGLRRNEVEL